MAKAAGKNKISRKPENTEKAAGSKVVKELVGSLIELHSLQGVLLRQLKKKT